MATRELFESRAERLADRRGTAEELGLANGLEDGDGGGAREGIAAKRSAQPSGGHSVHQLGAAGDGGKGKPAAERLAGDEEIGLDAVEVLDCPHRPRPADA